MHTRQSGAAHVPIMVFLIVLLMFLGALGFAYVATDTSTKLRNDNATLRAEYKALTNKALLQQHYIEELGDVVKLPGKYAGRPSVEYEGATLDGIAGVISPADLKAKMAAFGGSIEIGATNGFEDTLTAGANKVAQLKKRITEIETERDAVLTQKNETDAKFAEATSAHSRAAGEWRQTFEQARADYDTGLTTARSTIGTLQENVRRGETTLAEEKESRAAERKSLSNDIAKLTMHNTALVDKDRMRLPPAVADGKVLASKSGLVTAYIDLGRKDMLQPGTIFQIKNPNEGTVKGYAKVTRVEQERAEVLLYDVADKVGDPVRDGDLLYNDLYSPNANSKRTICLLGRFSYPYNKPQLEALLKNLGNTVVAKMAPGVDTVLLGDEVVNEAGDGFAAIEESPEYKLALQLGVEFVPMRKVRDIVKPE